MIHKTIYVNDWRCDFYFSKGAYWLDEIVGRLRECKAPRPIMERAQRSMDDNFPNTGFTYSNLKLRRSIVVIGRTSSGAEFISSFCHELWHLVADIASANGTHLNGETVAYLAGDIAHNLSPSICSLSCNHCRRH